MPYNTELKVVWPSRNFGMDYYEFPFGINALETTFILTLLM